MSHANENPSSMSHANASLSSTAPPPLGIVVGIDPGLDKHGVVALRVGTCACLERRKIPNTIAGMEQFVERLKTWQREGAGPITLAMEEATAFGEALGCFLRTAGFEPLVVNAMKVARFREAIDVDANDLIDAEAVARFVMVQPDLARTSPTQAMRAKPGASLHFRLRQLSRRHQRWTQEHTAVCNELHAVLRMAWLADYQRFFSRVDGAAALAIWKQYPTPAEAADADRQDLASLMRQASRGRIKTEACAKKAHDIQNTAKIMVLALGREDPNRWSAWAEDIRMLSRHLEYLNAGLKQIRKQIEVLLESVHSTLGSFKGIGPVTAATIHGETSSIERFATADRFARYNGTAPREDSTGRTPKHIKNYRCNKRLRQAFMQLALNAPRYHMPSKAYQNRLKLCGITGGAARIRLARRLSDIIFAMLRDGREYNLEYYMTHKKPAA